MAASSRPRQAVEESSSPAPAPKRVFEWTGDDGQQLSLAIPKRIKRGKLARRIAQNDMLGALDLIFTPEEVEAFEDLDLSPEEWTDLQERLFDAIAGVDPKN